MHGLSLLIIVIGAFVAPLASAEVEKLDENGYPPRGIVIVEPTEVKKIKTKGQDPEGRSYLERRDRWGSAFSVGYSTYEPIKYTPSELGSATTANGDQPTFGDVYTKAELPNLEFQINIKRNLSYASVGAELAAGYYKNDADRDEVSSTLTLMPVRLGATFTLDNLYAKPYVVPYASLGGYVIQYKEQGTDDTTSGTTKVAPYFNLGAQFSLDWIDPRSAMNAFNDAGLQSTFVFLEMRKLMASSSASDPDLSNNVSFGGGLRLEF